MFLPRFVGRFWRLGVLGSRLLFDGSRAGPARLRVFFERSGGAMVKFGQMLSVRHDVFPEAYTQELSKLLTNVPPASLRDIEQVFIEETGEPLESFFVSLDPKPIAAASVGQVYKAVLFTDGGLKTVAVKIQRPNLSEIFETDFAVARVFGFLLDLTPFFKAVRMDHVVREFIAWTRHELDFRHEAANTRRLVSLHAETADVVFADVLYDSPRVLVSEFLGDVLHVKDILDARAAGPLALADFTRAHGIDGHEVARRFVVEQMRQYFIDGFFHADPHPGNVFILPDGRLGYFDCGIVGVASEKRLDFARALHAIAIKDIAAASKYFLDFARKKFEDEMAVFSSQNKEQHDAYAPVLLKIEEIMVDNFALELAAVLEPWYAAVGEKIPFSSGQDRAKSSALVLTRILLIARRYDIYLPEELVLFFRSLSIVDSVSLQLSASFDMIAAMQLFFVKYPVKTIEARVAQTAALPNEREETDSLENFTYEQLVEYKNQERERFGLAQERIANLIGLYAERYEEVRKMI